MDRRTFVGAMMSAIIVASSNADAGAIPLLKTNRRLKNDYLSDTIRTKYASLANVDVKRRLGYLRKEYGQMFERLTEGPLAERVKILLARG